MNIALENFQTIIFENSVYSHSNKILEKTLPTVQKDDILKLYQHVESKLSTRERLVLKMRYGLYNEEEYTQREIAKLLGISRSYVSRRGYCIQNRKERY